MDFIRTYFKMKTLALDGLFKLGEWAWDELGGIAFILAIAWTAFCVIGGFLLLPIDIITCAILWYMVPDSRESFEGIIGELALID